MKRIFLVLGLLLILSSNCFSQVEDRIKYDPSVTEKNDKIEFLYIAQEKLRIEHNTKGQELLDGDITQKQFDDWLTTYFLPKSESISADIIKYKNEFKKSKRFSIDLINIEK